MTDTPIYSISVLCYNRAALTRRCLTTVLERSPKSIEVIVTDNGSSDDTARLLAEFRETDDRIRIISHRKNLGVIRAKNIALDDAIGDFFVTLDNDCWVDWDWLDILRGPFEEDPTIGQVGRSDGYGSLGPMAIGFKGPRLDYIDGSCFMVRTETARTLGLCDPAFVMAYCEDADFSLRLRKSGLRLTVVDAGVRHAEHGTAHHTGLDLKPHYEANHRLLRKRWQGFLRTGAFGHPGEP